MILTVTANPALDKAYRIERFSIGQMHRPAAAHVQAGGKGINVARVYQRLGGRAVCTGFLGGNQGRLIAQGLEQEDLANQFIRIKAESRVCTSIVDPINHTQTEINEPGPALTRTHERKLVGQVAGLLAREHFDFLVLSGSLPAKASPSLYGQLIEIARRREVLSVVDSSGEALKHAVAAKPWLIKPNQAELETLAGRALPTQADWLAHAQALQRGGIAMVAASRGAHGACVIDDTGTLVGKPPGINYLSAIGSGDSFLAAFLWSWSHGEKPGDAESALRLGIAAGAANAEVFGAGACSREAIFRLESQVHLSRLS